VENALYPFGEGRTDSDPVGILHTCLERGILDDELVARPEDSELAA
jgi:hypothetical protein